MKFVVPTEPMNDLDDGQENDQQGYDWLGHEFQETERDDYERPSNKGN